MKIALLPDRAVLEISGEDRVAFLQGLISNDVTKARADQALWAGVLNFWFLGRVFDRARS